MIVKHKEYLWLEIEWQDAWYSSSHLVQNLKLCWQKKLGSHFHSLSLPVDEATLEEFIQAKKITTLIVADPRINLYPIVTRIRESTGLELYVHVIGAPVQKLEDLKRMKAEGLKICLFSGSRANTEILQNFTEGDVRYFPFIPDIEPKISSPLVQNRYIYSGRISYQKNLLALIDLFARYQSEINPAAELTICGGVCNTHFPSKPHGHYIGMSGEKFFLRLAELQGKGHKINYLGLVPRQQLKTLLSQHSTFVSLSTAEEEDLGLSLFEALSNGLSCVTTRWGGNREFDGLDAVELVEVIYENKTLYLDQNQFFRALALKHKQVPTDLLTWSEARMRLIQEIDLNFDSKRLKINLNQQYFAEEFFNEHQELVSLIGDDTEKVNWVVTSSLRPDLAFSQEGQNSFLSATQFPLLKEAHIPLKWLKTDPGFPILLIESSDLAQPWIYHPYDLSKKHYQLRQNQQPASDENTLVVLEETATVDDLTRYGRSKKFIFRDRENFELMKNAEFQIFNSYLFCFQSSWRPDLIVFQNPEFKKCLRPHIVHAIHLGGVIATDYWNHRPSLTKKLWYGTWELFDAV